MLNSRTGQLLVATPSLVHPTFRRTVILLLEDDDEAGSVGVVINRPLPVDVDVVLPAWQPHVSAPERLFKGGPVGEDSALGLAVLPGDDVAPGGVRRLVGGFGLVDLDSEPEQLAGHISGLRIFAGYAGWGAGQLRQELIEDSWFVVDAEPGDCFTPTPESLWFDVLRRQSGDLALVASFPASPELN
jgi:putative transcriptional regulator